MFYFKLGDKVRKVSPIGIASGKVVSVFRQREGTERIWIVVEDAHGMLHLAREEDYAFHEPEGSIR